MEKEKISNKKTFALKTEQNNTNQTLKGTFVGALIVQDIEGALEEKHDVITSVIGDVVFENCYIKYLPNLQKISGNLILKNSKIKYFDHLETIGGSLMLENSEILSVNNLKKIGRNFYLKESKILWIDNLETVGGNLMFDDAYLSRIHSLQNIEGAWILRDVEIDNMHPHFAKKIAERENQNEFTNT